MPVKNDIMWRIAVVYFIAIIIAVFIIGKVIILQVVEKEKWANKSLVISQNTLSDCLEISATAEDDNEIMGVRHKEYLVEGIQFHPESILTEVGMDVLSNFLDLCE